MTNNIVRIVTILIVVCFYNWIVTTGRPDPEGVISFVMSHDKTFEPYNKDKYYNQYDLLTIALSKLQFYLPIEVPQELLNLDDIYDPEKNYEFRMQGFHDTSIYKGKVYTYFGITPVITFYLPYYFLHKYLFKNHLKSYMDKRLLPPSSLVVLFFATCTLIFSALILIHIKNHYLNDTPEWLLLLAILVVGFGNLSGYLLRRPYVYEVAITGGYCFLTGALYFLFKFLQSTKNVKYYMLFFASLFLGLAIGCRPQFVVASIILLAFIAFKFVKENKLVTLSLLYGPFILYVFLLAIYNFMRFENIFELGASYQLHAGAHHSYQDFLTQDIPNTWKKIYLYIFSLIELKSSFPFIFLLFPLSRFEPIAGFLALVPYSMIVILGPYLSWRFKINTQTEPTKHLLNIVLILIIPLLINFLFLIFYRSVSLRHAGDFYTLLILLASILWFYYYINPKRSLTLKNIIVVLSFIITSVFTIVSGAAISVQGSHVGLASTNKKEFEKLEIFFSPISRMLSMFSVDQ